MKEKEFKLLKEKGWLVVPDLPLGYTPTSTDRSRREALEVELAVNPHFRMILSGCTITANYVMEFFKELDEKGKLKTQPYFPNLLPVYKVEVDISGGKEATAITRSKLIRKIIETRNPDSLELGWLGDQLKDGPNKIMVRFLELFLVKGKIKAGRKQRREFIKTLEHYSPEPLILENYWRKIALWIHPSDYPEYPIAQKLLFSLLKKEKKSKPKLRKLMWKGWKEGKDFEVFESYLDQPGLTPHDLLISIRDYERNPRISRWKKTQGIEIGKEIAGQEESEVVDLILLQLKERLLGMIKPKPANFMIPMSYYKIPAYSLLKYPGTIIEEISLKNIEGFKIISSPLHLEAYSLEGKTDIIYNTVEWRNLKQLSDFFIVGYKMEGWKKTKLIIKLLNKNQSKYEVEVNDEVRSLILFGYDSKTQTLKWIGEPSKTFYNGKPDGIKNWKKVWDVLMERKTILSLGDLAEKMYIINSKPNKLLEVEHIKADLKL